MALPEQWQIAVIILINLMLPVCFTSFTELVQTRGAEGICFNDYAVFHCTNFGQTYLNWEIVPPQLGQSSFPSFNSYWHSINFTRRDQAGASPLLYNVTYSNTSFLSATVTIWNPAAINMSRVTCNGRTLRLIVTIIDHRFTPTQLTLTPSMLNDEYFTLSWSPSHNRSMLYQVVITPRPLEVPNELLTRNESLLIKLKNGTLYNVTILLSACPDRIHATFMLFGRCHLICSNNFFHVLQYNLNNSNASTATIRYHHDNASLYLECGVTGEWNGIAEEPELCSSAHTTQWLETESTEKSGTNKHPPKVFSERKIQESVTAKQNINKTGVKDTLKKKQVDVFTLGGSVVSIGIISFIFGIVLGVICGIRCFQKYRRLSLLDHRCHCNTLNRMIVESPTYEELGTSKIATNDVQMSPVDVEQNIAYDSVIVP